MSGIDEMGVKKFMNEGNKGEESNDKFKGVMRTFFRIKDELGLTKTDLNFNEIKPLIKLLQHSKNMMPTYNEYLEEKGLEERKVDGEYIEQFVKNYLKAKVSKNREGRKEGKEALKRQLSEKEKEERKNEFKKMVEELST